MSYRPPLSFILALSLAILFAALHPAQTLAQGPTLSAVSPTYGVPGAQITISGANFGAAQGSSTVLFGSTSATVSSWSATSIVAAVPNLSSGGLGVSVIVAGAQSNSLWFQVGTPPLVNSMSPNYGPVGTSVTFTGTNFGATQGSSTVTFGGVNAPITSWSNTQIVATIPASLSVGLAAANVIVNGLYGGGLEFQVGAPPNLNSFSPTYGVPGTSVTLTGSGFGSTQGSSSVTFRGVSAPIVSWSDTQVVATVPSSLSAGLAGLYIVVNGLYGGGVEFQVGTPPSMSSISPTSAAPGTTLTLTGTNFGASQGSGQLVIGGVNAPIQSWTDTQIVATLPNLSPSTAAFYIFTGTLYSPWYSLTVAPGISSISPVAGPVGIPVTIQGAGFGTSMGNGTVTLGTMHGTVASWTDTQIVVLVAPGSSSGIALVQQSGVPSNSVSFTVTSPPALTSVSPTSGPAGTQVTFTGTGFGSAQGNGTVLLGNTFGSIVSWSDTQIVATVVPGAANGTAQVIQNGFASSSYPFSVTTPTPVITSFAPGNGPAGTQVTINGSGFGAAQGGSRLVLGSTNGAVVGWSDSQIVATVAPGASSGVVQVIEIGVASNAPSFTVNTPTITSISPNTGGAGTQITINGSGFGASQGSGNVWIGTTYGTVVSWSDVQVVATVATGSGTGNAQILQNGVWSNSFPFTSNTPNISSVSPASGTPGTQITITGSGFGANAGTLQLGTQPGLVSTWSDSQIVATVASNSLTGIAQVQQNGMTSNALRFVVPTSGNGNAVTLTPSRLNLLVGQTQSIQALNQAGSPVTGLTWATTDPTIVSLSSDDPPLLTAVAPGHVTITAGDSSCDVTVWAGAQLPVGTTIWSVPGDGSGVSQIIPAVPSPSGVADTFAIQNSGAVQAVTANGQVAWTAVLDSNYTSVNADFLGGMVETTPSAVKRFDGITGQPSTVYSYNSTTSSTSAKFHTDGTIFTIDGGSVVGIDPVAGTAKFSIAMDQSSDFEVHTCEYSSTTSTHTPPNVGTSLMAGDGNFYVYYEYSNTSYSDAADCSGNSYVKLTTQAIFRVGSDGSSSKISLATSLVGDEVTYFSGQYSGFIDSHSEGGSSAEVTSMFSNADQGVIVTYLAGGTNAYCSTVTDYYYPYSYMTTQSGCVPATAGRTSVKTIGGSGPTPRSATWGNFTPQLQGSDGTFYGTMNDGSLAALDPSGNVKWTAPGYSPSMLTADGSLVAQSPSGQSVSLDQNGVATDQINNFPLLSWKGSYQLGSDDSVYSPIVTPMAGLQSVGGGNFTGNGTPFRHHAIGVWWCSPTFSGTCSNMILSSSILSSPIHVYDIVFGYAPLSTFPNQTLVDFSAAQPGWSQLIVNNTMSTIRSAFAGFPVQVQVATGSASYCPDELTPGVMAWLGCNVYPRRRNTVPDPSQEYVAYVIGNYSGQLQDAGITTNLGSFVFYQDIMGQAQWANGYSSTANNCATIFDKPTAWCALSPTYEATLSSAQQSQFTAIMGAIGIAIGNTGAHELGHQFNLPQMDCDAPARIACPGSGPHDLLYEFYLGSGLPNGGRDRYLTNGLTWTIDDATNLTRAFGTQ